MSIHQSLSIACAPRAQTALLALFLLLAAATAGCLGGEEEDSKPSLVSIALETGALNGTVEHVYTTNNQTQRGDGAEFSFDLANTSSAGGEIETYFLDPGNGEAVLTVDASDSAVLTYTYHKHGLYEITLGANDSAGNSGTMKLVLRVEMIIWYNQTGVDDPDNVWFNLSAGGGAGEVLKFELTSTVENPNIFNEWVSPSQTEVAWSLRDSANEERGQHTETLGEGESYTWVVDYQAPENFDGWHLQINKQSGDDNLNTNTKISILYAHDETKL